MLDCFKRDKKIIRDGFKIYSNKNSNLLSAAYSEIGNALERMHANMLIKYCKSRGYNRTKTINFFKKRHKIMLKMFDKAMDEHNFLKYTDE